MRPATDISAGSRRRGFITLDVVMATLTVVALGAALVVAVNRHQRGAHRLAETRGAAWAAEQALVQMQSGRAFVPPQGEELRVEIIASGDDAPAGHAWVRVHAHRNGRSAALVGLVPNDSVKGGGRP